MDVKMVQQRSTREGQHHIQEVILLHNRLSMLQCQFNNVKSTAQHRCTSKVHFANIIVLDGMHYDPEKYAELMLFLLLSLS